MAISRLPSTDSLQAGDQLAIGSTSNGDDRKASLTLFVQYLNETLTFPGTETQGYTTQYAVPSATGFNVAIDDYSADASISNSIHLILTPTADYAAGTITLPLVATVVDKQELLVNCTQQVNALTVDGNGATAVTGEPTVLAADDFFTLKFDIISKTWYRVA